ncbi:recombinase family protein [Clostridium oceanicum]|uniref:Recombinase family protein n=1 Tax=Clostridium oceanicum TaxID=1543 RepID=A0ABP3UIQ1_9CLOT
MERIAIYSRKSRETDTGESIKNQIDMCKDYFRRKEKCTFEIFQDEGFSGGNTNRPAFKRMIELAKHKQFDIIAVYKVDRIARNIVDFVNTFNELENHDVKLVSITEGFDPSTPIGKMMMMLLASFAEMERMNIAQRVKDNMKSLAKMGRWSGGTPPTGYKSKTIVNNNGKKETYLELIEEKQHLIESVFKEIAEGYSTYQVGKLLNISPKTVSNIISNPTYVESNELSANYLKSIGYSIFGKLNGNGYLVYNRRPRKKGKKLFNAKEMFVAVSNHKPVIDSKTFISANSNIKDRAIESKPRISNESFLAHLVECSCGNSMYIRPGHKRKDGTRNVYFVCSKKGTKEKCNSKWLRIDIVEETVINTFRKISVDNTTLDNYLKQKNNSIDYSNIIKNLKKQINKNNKDINSLTDKLVLLEGPSIDIVSKKINELANKNTTLNEELLKIERQKMFSKVDGENVVVLSNNIRRFLKNFDKIDITEKQNFIKSIVKKVVWNSNANNNKGKISIEFLK